MKKFTKIISVFMIVAILLSTLCVSTSAAVATPTIYNTGTRHVICTSLSTMAKSYYTSNYSYDTLSDQASGTLLASLRKLMKDTHKNTSSYDDCRDLVKYTDGNNNIVLIYSSVTVTRSDYINDRSNGWNREHVWPQSLGGFKTSGAGADLHHVRPSDSQLNSNRGSKLYGNVTSGTQAIGTNLVSGMCGGTYANNYFEPLDNVKGDVARICLYIYARYGGEISECSSITNVFQSVDVLLDWCELDPVDEWEMGRNDVVGSIQGNRNVFIDYPEYAWLIFDEEIPDNMKTPSGMAMNQDSNESEGGNSTAPETPVTPENPVTPETPVTPENPGNNTPEDNTPEDNTPEVNVPENNTPENNVPENNTPDVNTPETNKPETDKPNTDKTETENDDDETKKTDKDDSDDKSEESGCGASVAVSTICIVGIVGIAAVIKKKKED